MDMFTSYGHDPIDFKTLWSLGIEVYCYDFVKNSGFIQDCLDHYVWINVRSMMYMSGEAPFKVWVGRLRQKSGQCVPVGRPNN